MNFIFKEMFKKPIWVGLIIILLLGALVRFIELGKAPFWADEHLQFVSSTESITTIIKKKYFLNQKVGETPDPPLPLLISKLFLLNGKELKADSFIRFAFRLPSVLFGLGAIFLIFHLGTAIMGPRVGLFSSFLTAFLFHSVYYSREARPYAMMLFFTTAAGLAFIRLVQKSKVMDSAILSISMIGILYTHYFGTFMAIVSVFWLIGFFIYTKFSHGSAKNKTYSIMAFSSLAIAAVCYLPWVPALLRAVDQGRGGVPNVLEGDALPIQSKLAFFIALSTRWTVGDFGPWIVFLLAVLGVVWIIRKRPDSALLILPWLFLPWLILPWMSGSSLANFRYMIFGFPAFILIISAGLDSIYKLLSNIEKLKYRKFLAGILVAVILILLIFPSIRAFPRGLNLKCEGNCEEPVCKQFVDNCIALNWWSRKWYGAVPKENHNQENPGPLGE